MKKILISIICLLSITSISNASFWSVSSLNLYNSIDEWIDSLQDRMENFELEWGEESPWILSEMNKYAITNQKPACLDESKNITPDAFRKIVKNKDISWSTWIMKYLIPDCIEWKKDTHLISIVNTYLDLFNTYNLDKKKVSWMKSDQIYKISKIWLYADWDIDNSWFDLIVDIQDIDKMIFADVLDYEWEPNEDLDEALDGFLKPLVDTVNKLSSPNFWKDDENKTRKQSPYLIQTSTPELITTTTEKTKSTINTYTCSDDLNINWLSSSTLESLINNINNELIWWWTKNINKNPSIEESEVWDKLNPKTSTSSETWGYSKLSDNASWPCEDLFCINIEMKTYEHSLFGWWENVTIEYLLNRSNKHLSKHASTSLIPAKMWTNEFELGLKDLNLPDVFHLSMQVSTKPIPTLNIEKEWARDKSEYSAENMIKKHYEINWLNYNRRNDLVLLHWMEQNKQNINNWPWLSPQKLLEKQIENDQIVIERQKKTTAFYNTIDKKVSYWVIWTFEEQFTELDKFTVWINNYVNTLHSLVKKLREIPIEY